MVAHKHGTKIPAVLIAIALILCLLAVFFSDQLAEALGGKSIEMEYEAKLFDTSEIINIDIIMEDEQWEEMLSNAIQEEYYLCDLIINGTRFNNVGIRPKGNTSLAAIVNDPDTDRYSFKLEFDHFVKKQNCWGLDKLVLNNSYADYTYMKEALVYDMYQYLDTDASLYNYAKISVNGEYWGVYLALEAVEDSLMIRNYGTSRGALYKPDNMDGMGNGKAPGGRGANVSKGADGANLNYSDDVLDSYSAIWEGTISKTSDKDHRRVITALKNISEGKDLASYMDVDNLLKYMAVHIFSVNDDSLSGQMAHNYYLYEEKGRLNIIPWDYNLALGGMNGGDATSVVNDAIDMPFASTQFFDALLEDEAYLSQYHEYLEVLVDRYIDGGGFDEFYERTRSQIDDLVQTDPTAFCSYEEYQTAADMLYQVVQLRGDSIQGQLAGSIPSTESGQRADSSALIDASGINLSSMGTMLGEDRGRPGNASDSGTFPDNPTANPPDNSSLEPGKPPEGSDSFAPGQDPPEVSGSFAPGQDPPEAFGPSSPEGLPFEEGASSEESADNRSDIKKNLVSYGIYLAIMLLALIFLKLYRRRSYPKK